VGGLGQALYNKKQRQLFLQGERVRLRPIETDEDLQYLFHAINNPETAGDYISFEARSWEGFQNWIKEQSKSFSQLMFFLILKKDDGKIIGSVSHFVPSPLSRSCVEIGYGIDEPALRGKGFGSESVKLLVDYLFLTKPLERIQATTNIGNLQSQHLLEKLGFTKEGVLRNNEFLNGRFTDTAVFSLLRNEWERM
jgi:ribosomal-protein-alanine N-acetyltransferase